MLFKVGDLVEVLSSKEEIAYAIRCGGLTGSLRSHYVVHVANIKPPYRSWNENVGCIVDPTRGIHGLWIDNRNLRRIDPPDFTKEETFPENLEVTL